MKREDKREVVADLQQRMRQAKVAILTRFSGLSVERMTQLRRELRKVNVEYRVIKNTLFRLAVQGTDKEPLSSQLEGPLGVAWSNQDVVAPAKILAKYAKDFAELRILIAASEGKLWDAKAIQTWVTLPSLEELRARILGMIQAPASKLARLVNTPGTQVAQVLKARSEQPS